jgi:hypothetical protein
MLLGEQGGCATSPLQGLFSAKVVSYASACQGMGDDFCEVPADHFTVCRPASRAALAFIKLQECVQEVLEGRQVGS